MYQGPGTYRHYKNKLYFVIGLSLDTHSGETCVLYSPLYEAGWCGFFTRKLVGEDGFNTYAKIEGGGQVPRFIKCAD